MYRNVLVGVDQRTGSRDAIALARALAPHRERLAVVHVRNEYFPGMRSVAPDDAAAERDYSLELLRTVRGELGLDAEMLSVAATNVASGIHDAAEKIEADLIVVGSCHRSAIGRVMSGNDATSTLHQAPCTAAIAPHGYAGASRPLDAVGVAYDGSPQSTAALGAARLLGDDVAADKIRALDVEQITSTGSSWAAPYVEDRDIVISNARARLGDLTGVELGVLVGQTGDELVHFSHEVDVLVCGSRRRGSVKRVMLGSTSDYLIRHARSPLVIVPGVMETAGSSDEDEFASATA